MATDPPADLTLSPINGEPGTIADWVTTFQLAAVILDPFTNESAWLIETAGRLLTHFREADCRVAWLVTAPADEARQFLGPWGDEILTFVDPDRAFGANVAGAMMGGLSEYSSMLLGFQYVVLLAMGFYLFAAIASLSNQRRLAARRQAMPERV